MTYRLSLYEIELFLSFYRDIQKYNDLLNEELNDAHYGVDSQIYAAFKLNRVSESTKISYVRDFCSMMKKALKSWENEKDDTEYKAYRAIQLMYFGKHSLTQMTISNKIGCSQPNLRHWHLNNGFETFKSYFIKQLSKRSYTQSDSHTIIVDENYPFEYSRNLELMYYITSNIARMSREYFKKADSVGATDMNIHEIKTETKEFKEVS